MHDGLLALHISAYHEGCVVVGALAYKFTLRRLDLTGIKQSPISLSHIVLFRGSVDQIFGQ